MRQVPSVKECEMLPYRRFVTVVYMLRISTTHYLTPIASLDCSGYKHQRLNKLVG